MDEPGLLTTGKSISTKRHRGLVALQSTLLGVFLTGIIAGSVLLTLGVGQAAKGLMLSFDGPTRSPNRVLIASIRS